MIVLTTPLPGLLRLVPTRYTDDRGCFIVTFDQRRFDAAIGYHVPFVQDNESTSSKGVLRGLHFQLPPSAQGKLVHVVRGRVLDVCVDLRPDSPTLGRHYTKVLDTEAMEQLWIPPGSHMVSWRSRTIPSSPTSAPATMTLPQNDRSAGTTRIWPSNGGPALL